MPTLSMPRYWQAVLLVWRGERPCFAVAMMKECDLPGPTSTNHLEKVEEGKSFECTEHWKTENIDSKYLFWLILIVIVVILLYWIHSAAPNKTHPKNTPIKKKYPYIQKHPTGYEMWRFSPGGSFKFLPFRPPSSPWGVWPLSRTPRELVAAVNRRPVLNYSILAMIEKKQLGVMLIQMIP